MHNVGLSCAYSEHAQQSHFRVRSGSISILLVSACLPTLHLFVQLQGVNEGRIIQVHHVSCGAAKLSLLETGSWQLALCLTSSLTRGC